MIAWTIDSVTLSSLIWLAASEKTGARDSVSAVYNNLPGT